MPASRVRLLLVGAGHAHLEILRRIGLNRPPELETTVVSQEERHFYSGMTPGYLSGQYSVEDISFDVPAMARRVGASCVIGRAARLEPRVRQVALADGRALPYDLLSLNIGSLLAGADSGAAHGAERVKPLHRVTRLKQRLDRLAGGGPSPARIAVIGAGAAGVEIAFAAAAVMDRAGRAREITLLDRGDRILPGYGTRFARLAARALDRRGVHRRLGTAVTLVREDRVELDGAPPLASDLTVWLTGPEGAPLLADSGLPTEPRGFLWTEDTLRSIADPSVFAVGDCGTMTNYPSLAKSGVYAVREAPVLWNNLLAAARHRPLSSFRPQREFLSILNTADDRALLHYRAIASRSRWAWWLKDRIDRRFMARYQELEKAGHSKG